LNRKEFYKDRRRAHGARNYAKAAAATSTNNDGTKPDAADFATGDGAGAVPLVAVAVPVADVEVVMLVAVVAAEVVPVAAVVLPVAAVVDAPKQTTDVVFA